MKKGVKTDMKNPKVPSPMHKLESIYNSMLDKNQIVRAIAATLRLYLLLLLQKVISVIRIFNDRLDYNIISFLRLTSKLLVAFSIALFFTNSSYAANYAEMITQAEKKYNVPKGLLRSIALTESRMHPWAINSSKGEIYAKTREQAYDAVTTLIAQGITNIDIGICQLNIKWHGKNFERIYEMLNPEKNIDYAANLLASLYKKHKEWYIATRYYHSYNPIHYKKYHKKVLTTWLAESN
jgi:soluble lytic murein transglycosylase-like protein